MTTIQFIAAVLLTLAVALAINRGLQRVRG